MPLTSTSGFRLLLACLLLACLSTRASAQCDAYEPPNAPSLVEPILGDGPPTVYPGAFNFVWERVNMGACEGIADEIYQVVISDDPGSPIVYTPEAVVCTVSASPTCSGDYTNLLVEDIYIWNLRVVTNQTTDFGVFDGSESIAGVFNWCLPVAPEVPTISQSNTTYEHDAPITFSWTGAGEDFAFGKSCQSLSTKFFTLAIFQEGLEDPIKEFDKTESTFQHVYDPSVELPLPPGNYSWRIAASNTHLVSDSEIQNFTVLPAPPLICDPACKNGGVCNTTTGQCKCKPQFSGLDCAVDNSQTNNTPTPPNVGLIAGLAVAGFVVLLLITVLLILYYRITRKKGDVEMSILIEPPDFAVLALEPYDHLKPTPFMELNAKKPSWKNLENLFLAEDTILIQAILASAKIIHMDALCSSLVILYESRGAGSSLVQKLMLRELMEFRVTKGAAPSLDANPMPYRGDSAATKAFKVYCRLVGMPYLFETLGQILNDFCALMEADAKKAEEEESVDNKSTSTLHRKSNFTPASMEVDPSKMSSDEDETINRLSLQLICQKIFVKIFRSVNIFPRGLRLLFKKIREESVKNDNLKDINTNVLLSNLVFLRFVNPSIIMPKNFGLVKDEPSDAAKRQLVLVTKVLQNLAAGVEFGKKESFMTKLNDFIRANSGQMNTFLTELTEKIDASGSPQIAVYSVPISQFHSNAALGSLYEYLYSNHALLHEAIRREASPNKANQIIKAMMDVIEEFGDPATYKK